MFSLESDLKEARMLVQLKEQNSLLQEMQTPLPKSESMAGLVKRMIQENPVKMALE